MARIVGEPAGILGGGSIRAWMFLVSVNWATMPSTIRRITVVSTAAFGCRPYNLDRFDIAWHHTHRADRVQFLDVEKLCRVRVLEDLHRGNLLSLRRVGRGLGGRLVVGLLLVLGLRLVGTALVLGGITFTFGFGRGLPLPVSCFAAVGGAGVVELGG